MKVHHGFTDIDIQKAVVTTGSFDGVHWGHQAIIRRLKKRAQEIGGQTVLITFYPHPRKVLYPDAAGKDLKMINSQQEKIDHLASLGLDHLIIVEFTMEFSKTTSVDFIRNYLVKCLNVSHVIIGFNHHFGYNREGDLEYLTELGKYYGFTVEEIPEQDIQNESVSSTKIRKALKEGYIQRANAYLDHPYQLTGQISARNPISHDLLELSSVDEDKLLPPTGSYAISVKIEHKRYKGVLWILKPGNQSKNQIMVKVPGYPLDRIGNPMVVEFHKCLEKMDRSGVPDQDVIEEGLRSVEELIY